MKEFGLSLVLFNSILAAIFLIVGTTHPPYVQFALIIIGFACILSSERK